MRSIKVRIDGCTMYAVVEWNRHGASLSDNPCQVTVRDNQDIICDALDSHATDPRGTVITTEDRYGCPFTIELIS